MSNICQVCGKKPIAGRTIKQRGLAKKKGGVGVKTTGVSSRMFRPNLHKTRVIINGVPKTIKICAKCLKKGSVKKI